MLTNKLLFFINFIYTIWTCSAVCTIWWTKCKLDIFTSRFMNTKWSWKYVNDWSLKCYDILVNKCESASILYTCKILSDKIIHRHCVISGLVYVIMWSKIIGMAYFIRVDLINRKMDKLYLRLEYNLSDII